MCGFDQKTGRMFDATLFSLKSKLRTYINEKDGSLYCFYSFRNGNIVLEPVWRLQNGQGPSWKYAQAKVKASGNYQVIVEIFIIGLQSLFNFRMIKFT